MLPWRILLTADDANADPCRPNFVCTDPSVSSIWLSYLMEVSRSE